jgi:hypothetical protein
MINLIFQGRTTAAHQKLIDGQSAEGARVRRAKGFQRSRRDQRPGTGGLAGGARDRAARRHALVHHGGGRGGGGIMSGRTKAARVAQAAEAEAAARALRAKALTRARAVARAAEAEANAADGRAMRAAGEARAAWDLWARADARAKLLAAVRA